MLRQGGGKMRPLPIVLSGLTIPAMILAGRLICRDISAHLDRGHIRLSAADYASNSPWIEGGTGLFGAAAILSASTDHMALITAVLVGWFGLIAIIDHRHGVVPDRLVRPALWVGLILAACGQAILTPAAAILGAAGAWTGITALRGFAARYLPNRRPPQLGDGDVKLAAALGAWLGLWPALAAFAIAAALLAIFAAVRGTSRTQAFAPAFCLTALCLFVLQPFSSFDLGTRL